MNLNLNAQNDLTLDEGDAEGVVGGIRKAKKSAKHTATHTAAASSGPIMIKQEVTYGPTEISANSGDDDCAPDPSSPDATS